MTRSLLRPIRTRRVAPGIVHFIDDATVTRREVTRNTRNTVAAIGALWVSFAASASATPLGKSSTPSLAGVPASVPEQPLDTPASTGCTDSNSFSK